MRRALMRVALAVLVTLLGLAVVEIGCRYAAYRHEQTALRAYARIGQPGKPGSDGSVPLGGIIRPHPNPRIMYELIPGISVRFRNAPLNVSAQGFRSPSVEPDKPSGTRRLLGLGDSVMFGWAVADDQPYLAQLQKLLNERRPAGRWEVINTAVPGYNTAMEVATLKEKGLRFRPDIVLIEFVDNDLRLPNFIRLPQNFFSLRRSFLYERLAGRIPGSDDSLRLMPARQVVGKLRETYPDKIPPQFADLVGTNAYIRAMKELQSLSRKYGFEVVVLRGWIPRPLVSSVCKDLGFSLLECYSNEAAYAQAHNLNAETMGIEGHPDPAQHERIAGYLYNFLESRGLLDRAEEGAPRNETDR